MAALSNIVDVLFSNRVGLMLVSRVRRTLFLGEDVNLFQFAAENDQELHSRFDDVKNRSKDGGRLLDLFAGRVQTSGCVSINMRPSVLTELVNGRRHRNIYEWAEEQSRLSSRPTGDILREKLGANFNRRIHFDDAFEDGRGFRYGTLNIGGLGSHRYGQFCAVLRSDFVEPGVLIAYLMGDSLRTYMLTDTDVDTVRLRCEVCTHPHVQYLAALKHSAEIPASSENDWPRMVCRDDCYVEAIFLKDVELSSVDQVRIAQAEYDRLFDLAFTDYTQSHDDATHALKADFVCILRASRDGYFALERI